jgi:hypothetical protein
MAVLGILFFLFIMGLGFWMLIFLFGFAVPYWATMALMGCKKDKNCKQVDKA